VKIELETKKFIDKMNLENWFHNVFQSENEKKKYEENNIKFQDNLLNAVDVWQKNFEYRCDKWEELRVQVISINEWHTNFNFVREQLFQKCKANKFCNKLTKILFDEYDLNSDQFISELPVIGAWGEFLLGFKKGYYTDQLEYFQKGFWVCGIQNKKIILF
jgi:hypothetical protein